MAAQHLPRDLVRPGSSLNNSLKRSLVLHIWLIGPLYFLILNALTRFLRLQTTESENVEPCE